ncbi:MAG: hypothetical protein ACI8ZN_002692, partial [Bacteroidia bacterium]
EKKSRAFLSTTSKSNNQGFRMFIAIIPFT